MLRADQYSDLLQAANTAFWRARAAAWKTSSSNGSPTAPEERLSLYHLIDTGLPELKKLWSAALNTPTLPLRLSGVMCDRTPLAIFDEVPKQRGTPSTVRKELADLLVVYDRKGQRAVRRALFLQAKRIDGMKIRSFDPEQLRLYRDLPQMEIIGRDPRGRRFLQGRRDFSQDTDAFRYLLIEDNGCRHFHSRPHYSCCVHGCCGWQVSSPQGDVGRPGSEGLGATIVNMMFDVHPARAQEIKNLTNRTYPPLGAGDDLAITVDEILTKTFYKKFGGPSGSSKRERGEVVSFHAGDATPTRGIEPGSGSWIPYGLERGGEEGGEAPFAVILIEQDE